MMKIEIDQEIYRLLESHAQPFVDSPNSTLHRLLAQYLTDLKPGDSQKKVRVSKPSIKKENVAEIQKTKRRLPKADLGKLISAGLLTVGQKLFLIDYTGKRVPGFAAIVDPKGLVYHEVVYAMSKLAGLGLAKVGYKNSSIRGPERWENQDGVSVLTLWNTLRQNA